MRNQLKWYLHALSKKTKGICMGFLHGYIAPCVVEMDACALASSSLVLSGWACENREEFGLILLALLHGDYGEVMG